MKTIRRQYRNYKVKIRANDNGMYGIVYDPTGEYAFSTCCRNDEESIMAIVEQDIDDLELRMQKTMKCIVACTNANGQSDLYFVKVKGTAKQFGEGDHLKTAEKSAELAGYEKPYVTFDENDPAGNAMIKAELFVWDSASQMTI